MILDVRHFDVFARGPGGGNPCPVVLAADALRSDEMQSVAAHYGKESGFVLRDPDGGLRLRFFVPRHEMSMCVHATVAAVTALSAAGALGPSPLSVRTGSGECLVICTDDDPPVVTVEQQRPQFGPPIAAPLDRLAAAIGVPAAALVQRRPVRAVSVSRAKLIIALHDAAAVRGASPDLPILWSLCRAAEATGAYLFAPHRDGQRGYTGHAGHLVARQFPVDAGYPEDAATGVAAGALAAYLAAYVTTGPGWHEIDIDQGDAMGRPSALHASAFADATGVLRSTVSGSASLRRAARLDLADI